MRERGILRFLMGFTLITLLFPSYLSALPLVADGALTLTGVNTGKDFGEDTSYQDDIVLSDSLNNNPSKGAPPRIRIHKVKAFGCAVGGGNFLYNYKVLGDNYSEDVNSSRVAALYMALREVTTTGYGKLFSKRYEVFSGTSSLLYGSFQVGRSANSYLVALVDDYVMSDYFSLVALTNPDNKSHLVKVPREPVPEPGTIFLLGAGLAGTGILSLRRRSLRR